MYVYTWSDCCRHVQAKESEYWDIAVEDEIEQIIIQSNTDRPRLGRQLRRVDNVVEDTAEMYAENSARGETTGTAREEGETIETAGEKGETTDTADLP